MLVQLSLDREWVWEWVWGLGEWNQDPERDE